MIMKPNALQQHDIELLAEAWFEGRLDRDEEAALRQIVAGYRGKSEIIEQLRGVMGFECAMRRGERPARRSPRRYILSAAASLAALLAIGAVVLWRTNTAKPDYDISVYRQGRPVTDRNMVRRIAMHDMSQSRQFIREMTNMANTELDRAYAIISETSADLPAELRPRFEHPQNK